jgi:outer membrane receptor protein involved in Fe transport
MRAARSRKAGFVLALALAAGAARADETPTTLPELQVYATADPGQWAQADAASAGIVTQDELENRPISRPAEVLEVVPGLIATQHSGDGKANQYFLRGFNLDHGTDLAAFVDGVPNNLPTHAHGQGYDDLNGLIPELIDTLEYRKGPYYAEDGDFSSAGSVRIRYVDRLDRPFYQLTGGENGYARALLAGSTALGDRSLLFGLDTTIDDGPWDKPEHERRASFIAKLGSGDATRGHHLELVGYRNRWDASDQIPQRAVAAGLVDRFGQIDPDLGGDTSRYTLAGEMHMPLAGGTVFADAYFAHYALDLFSNFTYFLDDPVHGDEFEQSDARNYQGAHVKYATRWNAGAASHALAVGAEMRRDDIGRVGLYHTEARERIATVRADEATETSAAAFASLESRWTDRFRSIVGVRYDTYRADVASDIAANSGRASDARASPKLSLVFGPWSNTEVFVNAGRGFHSNDARGATLRVDPNDPSLPALSQQLLVPTKGEEIGVRFAPLDKLTLSADLWRLRIGSELVFSGDGGTTEPSYPSRRHGVELSARWQALSWLAIDADYATSHARFEHNPAGNRIPNAIERVASVGVEAQGPGRWSGGLRYRYLGSAPLIEDDSVRSHPTTLVNGEIGYALAPSLKLSAEVLNLFDSKASDISYFYESRLSGESAGVPDIHFHPVEPRQLRLTLRGSF